MEAHQCPNCGCYFTADPETGIGLCEGTHHHAPWYFKPQQDRMFWPQSQPILNGWEREQDSMFIATYRFDEGDFIAIQRIKPDKAVEYFSTYAEQKLGCT